MMGAMQPPVLPVNFLAHLYFAQPNVPSRVGNLLGDFARGVDRHRLPAAVRRGLENHRAVDRFTDAHPQVQALKQCFSPRRRRFAGIILDVLFDHFLIRHWSAYHQRTLAAFLSENYRDLLAGQALMPPRMQQVTRRLVADDWLGSYRELDNVNFVLNRIAGRLRFENEFADPLAEIEHHYAELEQGFQQFFPDLCQEVRRRAIESR